MATTIDARSRELLSGKHVAHLTTLRADGTPHTAVVWIAAEGDEVLVNSAEGRDWPANLRRDPRAWITVVNLDNPYEYVMIEGRVTEITPEGGDEHIDALAKKYLDADSYPFRAEGEVRLKIRIEPQRVRRWGG